MSIISEGIYDDGGGNNKALGQSLQLNEPRMLVNMSCVDVNLSTANGAHSLYHLKILFPMYPPKAKA